MRVRKRKKPLIREGICPICGRPLDKWNGQELCSNCGYVK